MMEFFTLSHIESVGILVVENDVITFINSHLCKIFKTKREQIHGINFEVFCGNYIKSLGADINFILKTGKVVENMYIPNDRQVRFRAKICPKTDKDFSCIFSIEEEKVPRVFDLSADFKLNVFDELSSTALSIGEYFPEKDDFLVLWVSKGAAERWGVPKEYVMGKFTIAELGMNRSPMFDLGKSLAHKANPAEFPPASQECEYVMNFGTVSRIVTCKVRFVGYSELMNPIIVTATRDISEQRKAEEELAQKQKVLSETLEKTQNLSSLCEHAGVPMGLLNASEEEGVFRIVYVNSEWYRVFEIDKERVVGKTTLDFSVPIETTKRWQSFMGKSKSESHPVYFEETVNLDTYGPHVNPSVNNAYVCVNHLREDTFIFVFQDITPVKTLENELKEGKLQLEKTVQSRTRQLQEALEVKSRFLAIMSHEIRTPLSGILGNLTLLAETALNPDQQEMLHTAQICGEQLLYVINDILDLTRMEENRLSLESTTFNINSVIQDSLDIVSVNAEKKNLTLLTKIEPDVPLSLVGDPVRLRQIFVNLLSNSVKFSSVGEIIISASLLEIQKTEESDICTVKFSVRDFGIGIPIDVQPRIFQPFFQADSSVNRRFGGSGLGLNISKRLAEMMGGGMGFESRVSQGSTFYFTVRLPIGKDRSSMSLLNFKGSLSEEKNKTNFQIPILVAEDNVMNQQVIQRMLKSIGYQNFKIVSNGQEAVEEARARRYLIILMDCMMPISSGFEATETIRKELLPDWQPFIIALTADAFKENAVKCIASGMNHVLTKPINKKELTQTLKRYSSYPKTEKSFSNIVK